MNIDDLTLGDIKKITGLFGATNAQPEHPWQIGANYLIRTVTMTNAGRVVLVTTNEIVLENASWIADTGKFGASTISCEFNEVELFNPAERVIIGRGSVIDAIKIATLPTKTK